MRLALVMALTAGAAQADTLPGSVDWLIAQSGEPRQALHVGEYMLDDSGIVGLDPLTLFGPQPTPLPAATAQTFSVTADRGSWSIGAALVMVLDDADPVCGKAIGGIGVDSGLATLASHSDVLKLATYGTILDDMGSDLFTALEPQLPTGAGAVMVTLPDGTRLPIASSGYGDGGYPVTQLNAQDGNPVAVYVDFIGGHDDAWIEPPPCANL